MEYENEEMSVPKENANEENNVQSLEKSSSKDFDNSYLNSEIMKKNHSGFLEELDFEDEPTDVCQNIILRECQLHDPDSENRNSVEEDKVDEVMETKSISKNDDSDLEGEILSGNSGDSMDDVEEGEVKDDSSLNDMTNAVCRYFQRGRCVWGNKCRFFHVTDKGLYSMFDNPPPRKKVDAPSVTFFPKNYDLPLNTYRPQPLECCEAVNSVWDRALVEAKDAILRSKARKEEEDFEHKKLYNSFGDDIAHFKKFLSKGSAQSQRRTVNIDSDNRRSGYKRSNTSVPFEDLRSKLENQLTAEQVQKKEVKYVKKSNCSEKWQDPWRRSKSPRKRKRRSHSCSSASSKKSYSERSSISVSTYASSSCSCCGKSVSPVSRSVYHRKDHVRNGSYCRYSRSRSVSRSVSRSRSRRTSCSSISSSSLSSVSSFESRRENGNTKTSAKVRDEVPFHGRQPSKSSEVRNISRYSPCRTETRRASSAFQSRTVTLKSPPAKCRRRNSSDMSISPLSDSYNLKSKLTEAVNVQKNNVIREKNLSQISKHSPFTEDKKLVCHDDHSDKMNRRSIRTNSDVPLKGAVHSLKVQEKKLISENSRSYSNLSRDRANVIVGEKVKTREKMNDLSLVKKSAVDDVSSLCNLSKKQSSSCGVSVTEGKPKPAKVKKIKLSGVGEELLKYHSLTMAMRKNNTKKKIENPSRNPINNPSVTSDCSAETLPKQESVKQKPTADIQTPQLSLNLHSKTDKKLKLCKSDIKMKTSKKSNLPPQTSRREQLLKQLKAVEEAIARKKTTI